MTDVQPAQESEAHGASAALAYSGSGAGWAGIDQSQHRPRRGLAAPDGTARAAPAVAAPNVRGAALVAAVAKLFADGEPRRFKELVTAFGMRGAMKIYELVQTGEIQRVSRGWFVRSVDGERVTLPAARTFNGSTYAQVYAALSSPRTVSELAEELGLTVEGARQRLLRLEKRGLVQGPPRRCSRRPPGARWTRTAAAATSRLAESGEAEWRQA